MTNTVAISSAKSSVFALEGFDDLNQAFTQISDLIDAARGLPSDAADKG
jgi:hypothetical protein